LGTCKVGLDLTKIFIIKLRSFRELNENMVEAILNRFLLVAQSFRQKNVTLWGQPFTVTVTTVNKSGLPKQRQIPGSGRNIQPVHHRINDQSLIKACLPSF